MHEFYERRIIRTRPRCWPSVVRAIRTTGSEALTREGGVLFGLFLPQIGLASDEAIVLSVWPAARDSDGPESPVLAGAADVVSSDRERLVATVRPMEPHPPTEPGVYAHRWFELDEKDWDEFRNLSEDAWPTFEAAFDTQIVGFWRSIDTASPSARVLLLTRYASLAVWEQSRMEGTQSGPELEARKRFRRRHELTRSTAVVTTRLALG